MPALTDDTYEAVKAMLMDGDIVPGGRISIDGLARALSVSQTPIREALARLESDGLTRSEPNRGYFATELPTREEFVATYDLRLLLEPWAAARAAARRVEADVAALRDCLGEIDEAPFSGGWSDYRSLTQHDQRFHRLVHDASGNVALGPLFTRMHAHLQNFRLYYGSGIGTQAVNEHVAVVTAIAAGDPESAGAAMVAHLEAARDRLLPVFDDAGRADAAPAHPRVRRERATPRQDEGARR